MKANKLILVCLFALFTLALTSEYGLGLLNFDEYTDETPQTIEETVEDDLGNTCTDCNVSVWLSYPNGTLHTFQLMPYNASSTKYQASVNMSLVNSNTTIYTVRITANRTSVSQLVNGTSDRTIITVYDVYPPADSQWDVGIAILLLTIQGIFIYYFIKLDETHIIVRYVFAALAIAMNLILFRVGNRILVSQGVTSQPFINIIDSANIMGVWITYLFTAYIFIYLLWYVIALNLRVYNESKVSKQKLGFR